MKVNVLDSAQSLYSLVLLSLSHWTRTTMWYFQQRTQMTLITLLSLLSLHLLHLLYLHLLLYLSYHLHLLHQYLILILSQSLNQTYSLNMSLSQINQYFLHLHLLSLLLHLNLVHHSQLLENPEPLGQRKRPTWIPLLCQSEHHLDREILLVNGGRSRTLSSSETLDQFSQTQMMRGRP